MNRASKLRSWARQCRAEAARTEHTATAEALNHMAEQNELMAKALERTEVKEAAGADADGPTKRF
ncbi:MAG TPA: hypothetical protein VEA44_12800 [Caulobacter sp.]|nr:hypothetical protein [Caulobacter sp.]